MYSGGYGHASWVIVLIPLAFLVLRGLSSSGRRRGRGRSQAPSSFFMGQPGRPPSATPPGAPPSSPPPGHAGAFGTATTSGTPAGWFTDPFVKHEQRYWSGKEWTEHVLDDGVPGNDPPPPARSNDQS